MSDFDFHRRLSAVERDIKKLKDGYQELDDVVDPKGWIGEAFELLDKDIDEVKQEIKEVNGKIDIILKHITGMDKM
ncbi:hypothetical protein PCC8801_0718 [Rippkaea orientalis PCC 8801]|uniref:Uncharacterized protein n=1 Tax=Rippkaea orientalis (strain PCC 8801 / RF-1) TaxID=41431 RepID=B7JXP5_RIPO1|nr:hypothetical protein [Rippkaea orientalis]ACK64802.1 hypothetical protein PCC8801_0718 [Rippkaea orientalis PCC 8801]